MITCAFRSCMQVAKPAQISTCINPLTHSLDPHYTFGSGSKKIFCQNNIINTPGAKFNKHQLRLRKVYFLFDCAEKFRQNTFVDFRWTGFVKFNNESIKRKTFDMRTSLVLLDSLPESQLQKFFDLTTKWMRDCSIFSSKFPNQYDILFDYSHFF